MSSTNDHIRKTFLTGVLFAVPTAVTIFIIYWVDQKTDWITEKIFDRDIPFLGLVIAVLCIYAIGMVANSLIGRYFLVRIDALLGKIPVVNQLYMGWKQIALTPGGTEGTFSRVVLLPDETGLMKWMGFTSGRIVDGGEPMYCVFVPSSPNPITGRLYFVPIDKCTILSMSVEEAFKLILSTGNYVPPLTAADDQPVLTEIKG
jgi:uncharacterized membrane protein